MRKRERGRGREREKVTQKMEEDFELPALARIRQGEQEAGGRAQGSGNRVMAKLLDQQRQREQQLYNLQHKHSRTHTHTPSIPPATHTYTRRPEREANFKKT